MERRALAWDPGTIRALPIALLLLAASAAPAEPAEPGPAPSGRTVLVLLFDGFAPELVDANPTPALDRIRREGVWTHGVDAIFPSVSLISQVTISTGCWPETHGIVSNLFRDPERGRYDHDPDPDWLIGCEHLHQAAERQGVRSASYWWVGTHSRTHGAQATYVSEDVPWDETPEDDVRAERVAALLRLPAAERPSLVVAYFRGPDGAAHFTGMESEETRAAVARSDAAVGTVLAAVDALPDRADVSVFVTTDHGMRSVESVVNIARILRRHDVEATPISSGTSSFLYFDDPSQVADAQRKLAGYEEFEVVARDAQPPGWRIGAGPRVGQLIVSAKPPYFIEGLETWPWFMRWLGWVGPDFLPAGGALYATHGWPAENGVDGMLYAWGSGLRRDVEVPRVRAVDLHPTVTGLLGIEEGRPVDGTPLATFLER